MRTRLSLATLALAFASLSFAADSWPGFRGPTADGHSPSKNPPTKWSEKETVAWKTEIHGKGWSSPVVLGDQVWVTTSDEVLDPAPPKKKGGPPANPVKEVSLFAVGLDRKTGKVLHDLKLGRVRNPQYCHPFNTYASGTPFLEEGRLYAHFGSLGTFCIDTHTGKTLWERLDFKCDHFRGPGSSVAVYGDLVYLIFDGADLQYVVALDKKTGETKWKADRKIKYGPGPADGDHKKAYATPALLKLAGKDSLVCPSAECTIAYDPKSGAEQWRFAHGGMNGSLRPVLANGLLYATSGSSGKLFALKPDVLKGEVPKDAVAWQVAKGVSVRPSPIVVGNLLFMAADNGVATCLDAVSGKLHWTERLDGEFSASPVYANGNVYFCNQIGKTFVVKAAASYELLAENRLDGGFMASPAIAWDELFLRTKTHLYAIGKK
ncbi:outer membrane biogenesis protein BamB [Gemmata obscuriglobus]|uniref:Quinonprotein alcohol dehydrogenase n=1 Tax=Gemmata obscuriglobus TaxID=114 RepID=A0A2Z3GPQ8_9BACT|nr:PQQ-binding-like beta-propeller repeat protein [Gemmata obscuriglobus]AWM36279.1 quinonprotein alcohol dehydrogenase [Gemmata obscuriglobus]QEG31116.1 outer membrane biogenesis protein BamB [Gemmata obscuriglobus]VTS10453.1 Pyrrolo-quinoline quinone OS=Pirellula staleyi (strain ATCC 27377 / DSM 6068 / ICPB 4128) GN=Psta_1668 PE=4 SV=1: PQQ_2: PQQ_2 [Gemmata obscuriglobus UQM 2246]